MHKNETETRGESPAFVTDIARCADEVYGAHPEFLDLRSEHPWLTGSIGDPSCPVWFIAEIPSERAVRSNGPRSSPEAQWTGNRAAILFREMLVNNGFKTNGVLGRGGWNCYVTNVMKHAEPAEEWKAKSGEDRYAAARAWSPALRREFELGAPRILVALGKDVERYLDVLIARNLVPAPMRRTTIAHYSYIGNRPGPKVNGKALGPMHPQRVAEYDRQFQDISRLAASL